MHAMQELKDALSVIDSIIAPGSPLVYFEYPTYLNVGDLLIMHGSEAFFADRGHQLLARYSDKYCARHLQHLPAVDAKAIIVLQGGGNFGDLYSVHQRLREAIVRRYPANRIVLFPQTAFFSSEEACAASAAVFSQHQDVHLLARDSRSLELFRRFSPHVALCPDMAHMLWGLYPTRPASAAGGAEQTFYLMRADKELLALAPELALAVSNPRDWREICSLADRVMSKRGVHYAEALNSLSGRPLIAVADWWLAYSARMISRINAELLHYDTVVTSRMHGHILACLLGMKTRLIDNSYGKNSAYYEHWTSRVPGCELIQAWKG